MVSDMQEVREDDMVIPAGFECYGTIIIIIQIILIIKLG